VKGTAVQGCHSEPTLFVGEESDEEEINNIKSVVSVFAKVYSPSDFSTSLALRLEMTSKGRYGK